MVRKKRNFGIVLFDKADINDHKSVDICTFIPSVDVSWKERTEAYINTIRDRKDKLIKNYTTMDLDDHEAITAMLKDNNIIGFSTVWNREFYGNDTVRIFNRWWEDPKLRRTSKIIGDTHLVTIAKHQLQIAKEHGFKWAFISRETTPKYLEKVIEVLDNATEYNWIFHDQKIALWNNAEKDRWQWVGYTSLNNDNEEWNML